MKRFGLLVAAVLMGATSVFAKNDVSTKEPFAATQSGSIYRYGDDTGVKTQVQDVWLERD